MLLNLINLMDDVKRLLRDEITKMKESGIKEIGQQLSLRLKRFIKRLYICRKQKRNPMILPIIMEV